MIKIENNIPVEKLNHFIYPWKDMKIGDSFLFPKRNNSNYGLAKKASKKHNCEFIVRITENGMRCWRIK